MNLANNLLIIGLLVFSIWISACSDSGSTGQKDGDSEIEIQTTDGDSGNTDALETPDSDYAKIEEENLDSLEIEEQEADVAELEGVELEEYETDGDALGDLPEIEDTEDAEGEEPLDEKWGTFQYSSSAGTICDSAGQYCTMYSTNWYGEVSISDGGEILSTGIVW